MVADGVENYLNYFGLRKFYNRALAKTEQISVFILFYFIFFSLFRGHVNDLFPSLEGKKESIVCVWCL